MEIWCSNGLGRPRKFPMLAGSCKSATRLRHAALVSGVAWNILSLLLAVDLKTIGEIRGVAAAIANAYQSQYARHRALPAS